MLTPVGLILFEATSSAFCLSPSCTFESGRIEQTVDLHWNHSSRFIISFSLNGNIILKLINAVSKERKNSNRQVEISYTQPVLIVPRQCVPLIKATLGEFVNIKTMYF